MQLSPPNAPARGAASRAIRAASTADLDTVNQIVEAALHTWDLPERVLRLTLPSLRYACDDLEHMHLMLARDAGGRACGVAAWEEGARSDAPAGRRALLLHGLYVAPHAQRAGIGTQLLQLALEAARARGLDGVTVRAWREAEGYFVARGFAPLPGRDAAATYPRRLWRAVDRAAPPAMAPGSAHA